jgi:signal transduction histidine kinase
LVWAARYGILTLAFWQGDVFMVVFSLFFAVFAWLVAPRQPRNPVVWIMASGAFIGGLSEAGFLSALVAYDVDLGSLYELIPATFPPGLAVLILIFGWMWVPAIVPTITFGLLLFPDGKLVSPRWRWAGAVAGAALLVLSAGAIWSHRPSSSTPINTGTPLQIGLALATIGAFAGLAALVARYRVETADIRQQLKWILFGTAVFVPVWVVAGIWTIDTAANEQVMIPLVLGEVIFLTSFGIAVGKYRLYDIDLVISKTLVYGLLAVFITAVYVGAVVGIGGLIGGDKPELWLSIGATAVVAIAFEPLRRRLRRLANRLVYGRKATPYEVLSDFSRTITSSDDQLVGLVARSLVEGTTAESASVWVKSDGGFVAAATWPVPDEPATLAKMPLGQLPDGDVATPVTYQDELLGVITLSAARGHTLQTADEILVEQVASGMGLALRNIRLSDDLRHYVDALARSRQRLLTAQDEARRRLEGDIHAGPQNRLVGLQGEIGDVRKAARDLALDEVTSMLDAVTVETKQTVDSLGDFARGLYPALLETAGPVAAIASQVENLPIPATIHARGVGRHDRIVEATVYFCVLEALQNVVKHARATSVHVAFREDAGSLVFEVSDDGVGFDPTTVDYGSGLANLADRLDTLGGELQVESSPDSGTTVMGRIPLRMGVPA